LLDRLSEGSVTKKTVPATELIDRYIEPNPHIPGEDEVRIVGYGVPVWALIGHFKAVNQDRCVVAHDYALPLEAVDAALAFYHRHRAVIDARIAANAA
jgi:uncharacterized protein (DUF433 family)